MIKTELRNTQELKEALGELDELSRKDNIDVTRLEKLYAAIRSYNVKKHLSKLMGTTLA